jgi:hypothetical protein
MKNNVEERASFHKVQDKPAMVVVLVLRCIALAVFFTANLCAINVVQVFPGLIIRAFCSRKTYVHHIQRTERAFTELILLLHHFFAPCHIVLSGDDAGSWIFSHVLGHDTLMDVGTPLNHPLDEQPPSTTPHARKTSSFVPSSQPENAIVISNHLTYADWVWIWAFAYLHEAHGVLKIILKEAPKRYPLVGWVSWG